MRGKFAGALLATLVFAFLGMTTAVRADVATFYLDANKFVLRQNETVNITIGVKLDREVTSADLDVYVQITGSAGHDLTQDPLIGGNLASFSELGEGGNVVVNGSDIVLTGVSTYDGQWDSVGVGGKLYYFNQDAGELVSLDKNISIVTIALTLSQQPTEDWSFTVSFFSGAEDSYYVPVFMDNNTEWSDHLFDYRVNGVSTGAGSINVNVVPEPATWATLMGFGLVGAVWYRRRRHR